MKKGQMIIISGPSGSGKGTICRIIRERTGIWQSVSVTTRPPRAGEEEGVDYHYISVPKYQQMIADGALIENVDLDHESYGTPKAPVIERVDRGEDVLFEIDVHGARAIKRKYPHAIAIFVMAPSYDELAQRVMNRANEPNINIQARLDRAKHEIGKYELFDYFVINDVVEDAADKVLSIMKSERSRVTNNLELIKSFLK